LSTDELDREVRLHVYESFLEHGRPPSVEEAAAALGSTGDAVAEAFRRLEAAHVLVLAPGTLNVWMANPLSAFPTPFRVATTRGDYWGTCIWDAFGVVAMLGGTGTISTQCADCGSPLDLSVHDGLLREHDGVAHFAVPARHWWDNIGYT
jgi:hypothetical protein